MIVTPMRPKKHEGFDRTGDFCSRVKMSQDLAQVINDGLVYYEEHNLEDQEDEKSWIGKHSFGYLGSVTEVRLPSFCYRVSVAEFR